MGLTLSLLLATFAIRGEAPVSQPVYGPAPAEQSSGIIASDGDGFLAAWFDNREGRTNFYAARMSGSGELLDPTDIRIATNPRSIAIAGPSCKMTE